MSHYFTNNEDLKSEFRNIEYRYKDKEFKFLSDNGVFSKDKIDFGSKLLVETYLNQANNNINFILDVGCGYGYIGITLAKVLNVSVDMIDVNKRAVHLAKKNIESHTVNAQAFVSDAYENIDKKYDLIITNPPIRVGKEILLNILRGSINYLNESGELWFVIRKDQGAKSTIKELSDIYKCEIKEKSKGFYIVAAKQL